MTYFMLKTNDKYLTHFRSPIFTLSIRETSFILQDISFFESCKQLKNSITDYSFYKEKQGCIFKLNDDRSLSSIWGDNEKLKIRYFQDPEDDDVFDFENQILYLQDDGTFLCDDKILYLHLFNESVINYTQILDGLEIDSQTFIQMGGTPTKFNWIYLSEEVSDVRIFAEEIDLNILEVTDLHCSISKFDKKTFEELINIGKDVNHIIYTFDFFDNEGIIRSSESYQYLHPNNVNMEASLSIFPIGQTILYEYCEEFIDSTERNIFDYFNLIKYLINLGANINFNNGINSCFSHLISDKTCIIPNYLFKNNLIDTSYIDNNGSNYIMIYFLWNDGLLNNDSLFFDLISGIHFNNINELIDYFDNQVIIDSAIKQLCVNNLRIIKYLINSTVDLNYLNNENKSLLSYLTKSFYKEHQFFIGLLLNNFNTCLNVLDTNGYSPIHNMCINKEKYVLIFLEPLIKIGMDVNLEIGISSDDYHYGNYESYVPLDFFDEDNFYYNLLIYYGALKEKMMQKYISFWINNYGEEELENNFFFNYVNYDKFILSYFSCSVLKTKRFGKSDRKDACIERNTNSFNKISRRVEKKRLEDVILKSNRNFNGNVESKVLSQRSFIENILEFSNKRLKLDNK